jgi:uncharacterized protein (TIGR02270 family)
MHDPAQRLISFATGLYEEHLSEASFLYEQRRTLLDDPEITWMDIGDFEDRFEAHIDGLMAGEDLALEACRQQAGKGDFGELHAAMRVFCRHRRLDLVFETINGTDPQDADRLQAIRDALNDEMPAAWQKDFIALLKEENPKLALVVPAILGYQRLNAGRALLHALDQRNPGASFPTLIWALGRLREQNALLPLLRCVRHEDEAIDSAAALALLRMGEPQTVSYCLSVAHSKNWPLLPLGLSGSRSVVQILHNLASHPTATPDCLTALGLLGDPSVVATLLANLANTDMAESAASALNLITGAELSEEVLIVEKIDEDDLFKEVTATQIARLSRNPEDWRQWWAANQSGFEPSIRYRNGKPYSPACLLENLESEKTSRRIRQLAYEELVIRYGVDFPFETDMPVAQQKQALAKYTEWIKTNGNRFREGQWYFAGRLI